MLIALKYRPYVHAELAHIDVYRAALLKQEKAFVFGADYF